MENSKEEKQTVDCQSAEPTGQEKRPEVNVKLIVKTALITLMLVVFAFGYFVVTISAVAPKTMANTFASLGFNKTSYLVYKRVYAREKTNENLYNVIQLSISRKNYKDMEYYIDLMLSGDNFNKFSAKVDEETKKVIGEEYNSYINSYANYLASQYTIALYNNGKILEAKMIAIDSLDPNSSASAFYAYTDCVMNDKNLLESQKTREFRTLKNKYGCISELNARLAELDADDTSTLSKVEKIEILEQKIRLNEIMYRIGKYTEDEVMAETSESAITNCINEINTLRNN